MTTLYDVFNLLPPPPPTVFSRADPHNDRARFPDFLATSDPAEACRRFMHELFAPSIPVYAIIQIVVLASLLAIIVPAAQLLIFHRIRKKRFWVFRLVPAHGKVPVLCFNSSNIFVLCGGLGLAAVAAALATLAVTSVHHTPIHHFGLLYCWTWVPLFIAVFYNAWGLVHAKTSTSFDSKPRGARGWLEQLFQRHALLANMIQLTSPILLAAPAMIISALYEIDGERALSLWENEWRVKYARSPLTQEMLREAQEIWYMSLRGYYFIALAFVSWTVVLPIFGIFHHTVLWSIIRDLRASIQGVTVSGFEGHDNETITLREDEKNAAGFFPPICIPKVVNTPTKKLLQYGTVMYWAMISAAAITSVITLSAAFWVFDGQERARGGVVVPALSLAVSWVFVILGYVSAGVILWGDFETTFSAILLRDIPHLISPISRHRSELLTPKTSAIRLRLIEETIVVTTLTAGSGQTPPRLPNKYGDRPFHEPGGSTSSIAGVSLLEKPVVQVK